MRQVEYRLKLSDDIAALIRVLHPNLKKKIKAALKAILSDSGAGKALKAELSGLRSFRVGRFRIVYKILPKKELAVIAIGSRETIYEETFLLLKREGKIS